MKAKYLQLAMVDLFAINLA